MRVEARIESLPRILEFVEASSRRAGAADSERFAVKLAVEEACVNIILHGYEGMSPGPIDLALEEGTGEIRVTIADRARPFPPSDAPAPDVTSGWEERRPGGLGWFLIRKMMDEVHYEPVPEGGNRLTLVKRLGTGEPKGEETHGD
jgi:serine/threonine-protein kinase RsbW